MLVEVLAFSSLFIAAFQLFLLLFNLFFSKKLDHFSGENSEKLSLLIPVRNEAKNLPTLFNKLQVLDPSPDEIIFYEDQSSDNSFKLLKQFAAESITTVKILQGKTLPANWLGKNHACHQLAKAANYNTLIFCDADVLPESKAIIKSKQALKDCDLFSTLNRQELCAQSDKALVVSVIYQSILGGIPLPLVDSRFSSLTAAVGHWLAVRKEAYIKTGGHEAVKSDTVDDMALATLFKKKYFKVRLLTAPLELSTAMYKNNTEAIKGFEKNIFALCKNSPLLWFMVYTLFIMASVLPLVLFWAHPAWTLALLCPLLSRIALTVFYRLESVSAQHLLAVFHLIYLFPKSLFKHYSGRLQWKDRLIPKG